MVSIPAAGVQQLFLIVVVITAIIVTGAFLVGTGLYRRWFPVKKLLSSSGVAYVQANPDRPTRVFINNKYYWFLFGEPIYNPTDGKGGMVKASLRASDGSTLSSYPIYKDGLDINRDADFDEIFGSPTSAVVSLVYYPDGVKSEYSKKVKELREELINEKKRNAVLEDELKRKSRRVQEEMKDRHKEYENLHKSRGHQPPTSQDNYNYGSSGTDESDDYGVGGSEVG